MKILWVSLVAFPPLSKKLGQQNPSHCGWLYSSAKMLLHNNSDIKLGVIVYCHDKHFEEYEIEGITYYMVPTKNISKTDKKQICYCQEAIQRFSPDLIHIHGTEHSLAKAVCIANNSKIKTLANIQGLAGPISRYADGGLTLYDKLTNITPLDFYRGTSLLNIKRSFQHRGMCENFVISNITDIIGRTQWDYDHALTMNPDIRYHFMNETLRDSFYEEPIWHYAKCIKHTIFVSNSGTPLKGAHQVLKALPIILRKFPDTKVNFCGSSVMSNDLKTMLRFQGYHLYLRRLVKKLKLENYVSFLGNLTEQQMKQEFLNANVYVLPSAIENSPNSLCEAQILGVPVIASYCGGVPTLVEHGKTGFLYRFEEHEMLAHTIIRIFEKNDFCNLSSTEREIAHKRHDKTQNVICLVDIYKKILNNHFDISNL